jgi:hypothetical protein
MLLSRFVGVIVGAGVGDGAGRGVRVAMGDAAGAEPSRE